MATKSMLIFDDGCKVCSLGVRSAATLTKDDDVRYVGMSTEEGKGYVQKHALDMNASAYLIHADGTVQEKEAMAAAVLRRGGPLGYVLSLPFRIPYVSRFLYNVLAWVRFHTTKTPH